LKYLKILILTAAASANSQASLILLGTTPISGAGLGNVNTVLTLQSPAALTTEAGCVLPGATAGVGTQCAAFGTGFTGGTVLSGTSQIGSPTLGTLGIIDAANLRIILNATEPAGNPITVEQLALNLYSGTTLLGTTHTLLNNTAVTIPNTITGVGQAGFAFGLNAAEVTAVNNQLAGLTAPQRAAVQLTLAAQLSGAEGGPDTFSAAAATGGTPIGETVVPEPATMALVGSALLGGVILRRKRR
jgi:hypothetical protein